MRIGIKHPAFKSKHLSVEQGEAGCLFDATQCRVEPAERPAMDGGAG